MNANLMTETDACALCLAHGIKGATSYAESEADKASAILKILAKQGKVDEDTRERVSHTLNRNLSAMSQRLQKSGVIQGKQDALMSATAKFLAELSLKEDEAVNEITNA